MKILFLHGWQSVPGGVKPKYLESHGHEVIEPELPDDDFQEAVRIAQAEFDQHQPRVIVGSSRGGAVAMDIKSGTATLVLLCPAWKKLGRVTTVRPDTVILHSRADDAVPFVDSEELATNSGATLIRVGNDHRLADPVPLQRMLGAVDLAVPTLCLGIDVAWWGGSPGRRDSQRDTIVYTVVSAGTTPDLRFRPVDLSAAKNFGPTQIEANFDSRGELLVEQIKAILGENTGNFQRCVVALDAPLEARRRENQPPRVKAAGAGQRTGAERRGCEKAIQRYKKEELANGNNAQAWHSDLRIQSGSPIAPRIASVLTRLSACDFQCWGNDRNRHERQIIEIFPSEAIWSLGLLDSFPQNLNPKEVRSYKNKKTRSLNRANAMETALMPLLGFVTRFQSEARLPWYSWSQQVAEYACNTAVDERNPGSVRTGKGFDDPIESGIAFLTAVSFVGGLSHMWGDGSDGTIVGPGLLQGG